MVDFCLTRIMIGIIGWQVLFRFFCAFRAIVICEQVMQEHWKKCKIRFLFIFFSLSSFQSIYNYSIVFCFLLCFVIIGVGEIAKVTNSSPTLASNLHLLKHSTMYRFVSEVCSVMNVVVSIGGEETGSILLPLSGIFDSVHIERWCGIIFYTILYTAITFSDEDSPQMNLPSMLRNHFMFAKTIADSGRYWNKWCSLRLEARFQTNIMVKGKLNSNSNRYAFPN